MKKQTIDGSWVPHTKEELDKEMNRQKELAEREKEAVEELRKIHSNVISGGLKEKQVSVDEDSSKAKNFSENSSASMKEERTHLEHSDPNVAAEREIAQHASVVKSGRFKEVRQKQKSTSSNTSTSYVDASTGEPQAMEKSNPENFAQDIAPHTREGREAEGNSTRKTLWRFLCCAVVEESK